mgnify:CR=1 FL=1
MVMWIDKYAPKSLEEFVGNNLLAKKVFTICDENNSPHIIMSGPSGIGKTTLINMVIKNQIHTPEEMHNLLLRFDSTDDRSIQSIREKICQFVPRKVNNGLQKIVLFEQADKLGDGVQQLMRGLMEKYTHNTIFIFVCDFIYGMNDAIQSRCMVYQFTSLSEEELIYQQKKILNSENIENTDPEILRTIAIISNGDLRQCINYLQTSYGACMPNKMNIETIKKVCLFPHFTKIQELFREMDAKNISNVLKIIIAFHTDGYSSSDIIMFINSHIQLYSICNEKKHLNIMKEISLGYNRVQSVDSSIQLCGILVRIMK